MDIEKKKISTTGKVLGVALIAVLLFLSACDGGETKGGWSDATTDTPTVNIAGKFQKGRCAENGAVMVWPIQDGTLTQYRTPFIGFTKQDGAYSIRASVPEKYVFMYFQGWCDDEANGGQGYQELYGYRKTSDQNANINVLTKISAPVAEDLLDGGFGTPEQCIVEAERQTLEYLSMPESDSFSTMTLEKYGIKNGVLALASAAVLFGRNSAEQGDYMSVISAGIIANNPTLKAEVLQSYDQLLFFDIKSKLESSYASIGITIDTPPLWRINAPAYYARLIEEPQIIQGSFNLDDNSSCSFDQSTFRRFAIPRIIESWLETSNYIASNLPGDVSIWTRGTHANGYDAPGTKLLDVEQLREKLLNSNLLNHGMITGHGLSEGDEVYFVVTNDTGWALTTGCDGGLLPWGRKLASDDDGASWIGWNNNTVWFRRSGLKLTGVN